VGFPRNQQKVPAAKDCACTCPQTQGGAIYLCGRADGDPSRYFSGSLAHLALWDYVLRREQVTDLYRTVLLATLTDFKLRDANDAPAPGAAAPAPVATAGSSAALLPGAAQGVAGAPAASQAHQAWTNYYLGGAALAPSSAAVPAGSQVRSAHALQLPHTVPGMHACAAGARHGCLSPRTCPCKCPCGRGSVMSGWGAGLCAQLAVGVAAVGPVSASAQQLTVAGRPCQFPFFYRGEAHSACVPYSSADSSAFCLDADGHFSMCSAAITGGYSQPVSWLDQWAGQGQLQTQVLPPHSPSPPPHPPPPVPSTLC
jgi:hypothetical protein